MSQDSVLGPILSEIFLCEIFYISDKIHKASYGKGNISFTSGSDKRYIRNKTEPESAEVLMTYFKATGTNGKQDKCHTESSKNFSVYLPTESKNVNGSLLFAKS